MRFTLCIVTAFLFFVNCNNDPTSSASVVCTELWTLTDVDDTTNTADITFDSLSNGTVSVGGKWVYDFYGNEITCKFITGSATVKDTSVSINVTGTASYPPDSSGAVESSPFTLSMSGKFCDGDAQGTWEISFTKESWNEWVGVIDGTFTGILQQGQGITK